MKDRSVIRNIICDIALFVAMLAPVVTLSASPVMASFDTVQCEATPSEYSCATPSDLCPSVTDDIAPRYIDVADGLVTLPLPEREGYRFVEWNTELDGSGESYQAGDEIEIYDGELYAIWEAEDVYIYIKEETPIATASDLSEEP